MVVLDDGARRTVDGYTGRWYAVELAVRLADEHRISGDHETVETEKPTNQLTPLVLIAIDEAVFEERLYAAYVAVVGLLNAFTGRRWTGPESGAHAVQRIRMGEREVRHAAELAGEPHQWLTDSDEKAVLWRTQQAAFDRGIYDRALLTQADRIGLRNEFAIQNGVDRRAVGVRVINDGQENQKKYILKQDAGHFRVRPDEIKV